MFDKRWLLGGLLAVSMGAFVACGGGDDDDDDSDTTPSATAEETATEEEATETATEAPETATAEATATEPAVLTPQQIVEALEASVVRVDAVYPEGFGGGSGVVWGTPNLILTNAHVVEGAAAIKVIDPVDGREINARVLGISPCDDLAILEVDRGNFVPAPIGSSGELSTGEDVVALGFPGTLTDPVGLELTVTRGIVSRLNQSYDGLQDLIQTDTPINPGNSGGALVNSRGEVVGINTLKSPIQQDTNYAIAIDEAKFIAPSLEAGERINWIGARMVANVAGTANYYGMVLDFEGQGVVVTGIDPASPAEFGGLGWADIVYRVDNVDVYSFGEVCDIMRSKPAGSTIRFDFRRTYIDPETYEYSGYEDFYTDLQLP